MYVNLPTAAELEHLLGVQDTDCVSVYVPTTPGTDDVDSARIAWKNQAAEAIAELGARGVGRLSSFEELVDDLDDDESFWFHQARTLAVFTDGDHLHSFQLPNRLDAITRIGDRYHLKPLLRSVTFPSSGLVLALAQGSVRVLEVGADFGPVELKVPNLPLDAASHAGKASLGDRSPTGRIQGGEGRKLRLAQYARAVDRALRAELKGQDLPVVLAAAEPIASIFRATTTLPQLATEGISTSPEGVSDEDLAAAARTVIDGVHEASLAKVRTMFADRLATGRAVSDLADIARYSTRGQIDTLLVAIEPVVIGAISAAGDLTLGEEGDDVVDEMARRTMATRGQVLAVRSADLPAGDVAAAILRWA